MTAPVTVDSSVLIAIFANEPEADHLLEALNASTLIIGAPTLLEVRIWCLYRSDVQRLSWLDAFCQAAEIVAFDGEVERVAAEAYARYGKGLNRAKLNYGDVMAYAVAAYRGTPLLFKGRDFALTDIPVHPASVVLA